MRRRWVYAMIAIVLSATIIIALAVMPHLIRLTSEGYIRTVGLECDVTHIDWGASSPGDNVSRLIHVMPNGTIPVNLTLSTENYIPANASDYLTLTWNYTNETLLPDVWYPLELTLHVAWNITGIENFSFDILLVAHDAE